jgi:hypothetical protein
MPGSSQLTTSWSGSLSTVLASGSQKRFDAILPFAQFASPLGETGGGPKVQR